jgi:sec-independent protein translocase protein TatA
MHPLFAILGLPTPTQVIILLVLAVLLFGRNLPEVARSLGQKLAEFRRAAKSIEDEIRSVASNITSSADVSPTTITGSRHDDPYGHSSQQDDPSDYDEPTAPKFVPPPA